MTEEANEWRLRADAILSGLKVGRMPDGKHFPSDINVVLSFAKAYSVHALESAARRIEGMDEQYGSEVTDAMAKVVRESKGDYPVLDGYRRESYSFARQAVVHISGELGLPIVIAWIWLRAKPLAPWASFVAWSAWSSAVLANCNAASSALLDRLNCSPWQIEATLPARTSPPTPMNTATFASALPQRSSQLSYDGWANAIPTSINSPRRSNPPNRHTNHSPSSTAHSNWALSAFFTPFRRRSNPGALRGLMEGFVLGAFMFAVIFAIHYFTK